MLQGHFARYFCHLYKNLFPAIVFCVMTFSEIRSMKWPKVSFFLLFREENENELA